MSYDLGQRLIELAENRPDILAIVTQYGHGDCHLMTEVLAETYDLNIIMVGDEDSGMPVHSAVLLSNGRTFDAYGINPLADTFDRYEEYVWSEFDGKAAFIPGSLNNLAIHTSAFDEEDRKQALADAHTIAEFIGVDLEHLATSAHHDGLAA